MKKTLILLMLIGIGCKSKSKDITKQDFYSKVFSNRIEIEQIRTLISDSLAVWERDKIEGYNLKSSLKTKIDTLICLNTKKDKLITCRLRSIEGTRSLDEINYFYGVKIDNSWYFFGGPSLVIFRENENVPPRLKQLSEKAYREVFKSYLKRNETGQLEINEDFFADLTSNAWYYTNRPKNKEEWDKRYLEIVSENRTKIDTNDYSKMK